MIIGLAGLAQSGKDTIGEVLAEHYGYKRAAFADKVRELALVINPIVWRKHDGDSQVWRLSDLMFVENWDYAKRSPDVRKLLQNIGEGGRNVLGADVWVNALFSTLEPSTDYAITDVRYQNEVAAIRNRGGKVWRVTRPGFDNGVDPNHPSEANVALLDVDANILNDGTVADLQDKVVRLMDEHIETKFAIMANMDSLLENIKLYMAEQGVYEGNLAMLYHAEDLREKIVQQFSFDDEMAVDPVLMKSSEI